MSDLLPLPLLANAGVPMIAVFYPAMLVLLIPVIFIEHAVA